MPYMEKKYHYMLVWVIALVFCLLLCPLISNLSIKDQDNCSSFSSSHNKWVTAVTVILVVAVLACSCAATAYVHVKKWNG